MSRYSSLRNNPPVIKVKDNARELVITTVSCMCDNVHFLKLKKNSEGDFKLDSMQFSLNNWQLKHPRHEIEWAADEGQWGRVFEMLNSGVEAVSDVISR